MKLLLACANACCTSLCACLPNTLIIDVTGDGRFKYRYVGTAVDGLGGEYLTDQYIEDIKFGGLSAEAIGVLQNVVAGGAPSYFSGECKGADLNRSAFIAWIDCTL